MPATQVQRHERTQQVLAGQDAQTIPQREVVDDRAHNSSSSRNAAPSASASLRRSTRVRGGSTHVQMSRSARSPRRYDLEQPLDIHVGCGRRRRRRAYRSAAPRSSHGTAATGRHAFQIGEQRAHHLDDRGGQIQRLLAARPMRSDTQRRLTQAEITRRRRCCQPEIDADLCALAIPDVLLQEVVDDSCRTGEFGRSRLAQAHAVQRTNERIDQPLGQSAFKRVPKVIRRDEVEGVLDHRPGQPTDPLRRHGGNRAIEDHERLRAKVSSSGEDRLQRTGLSWNAVVGLLQRVGRRAAG